MSWHERMNRSIDYIESNLDGEIDLEYAARISYQSVTSFQRTFSILTEMSISEYIRRRRMSLAVLDLQKSDAKIIDISLKYGYDLPDSFARAFKEIYGISPSVARNEGTPLKPFSRISFQLTIKGDVMMETGKENSGVQITNTYYERMPALRLTGKRYTQDDSDDDKWFDSKWNEWFQNGWFDLLFETGSLPGYENTGIMGFHKAAEQAWWIGVFVPVGTPVPEGFSFVDIPAGIVGMSWIRGYRHNREVYSERAHNMCLRKWQEQGNSVKFDFNGEICKWSFERYDNKRFFMPDSDGKVTLDYGIYLVESEISDQALPCTETEERSSHTHNTKPPEVLITEIVPYSVDIQSNSLFCALTIIFLKLENCNDATPYFCCLYEGKCSNCGDCGEKGKPDIKKHHMNTYGFLLTATGVGLMVNDPNETGTYDLKAMAGITPPLLEDRLDFAMKSKGFNYVSIDRGKGILSYGEEEIFRQVAESIRLDKPVLMKLSDSSEWCVATGYDEKAGLIYGLDSRNDYNRASIPKMRAYTKDGLFIMTDWFKRLQKAVIITGKTDKISFNEIIDRITKRLKSFDADIKTVTIQMIDTVTADSARGTAIYLNNITRYIVEARWYAADCFCSSLVRETYDETAKSILLECAAFYFDTHDACWEIWGQLGVGRHTDFMLPNLIVQMMLDKNRREKLKELFTRVWNNDLAVLGRLSAINGKEKTQ